MASFWGELQRRNVVRVAIGYVIVGWLVLQIADVLGSLLALPQWVGKLVILLLLIGLPLALFFAWAYEVTPEGLKREKDVDRSQSITHVTGRKLDFVIIGLMTVAIFYLVVDNYVLDRAPNDTVGAVTDKSVAVLPFVPLSSGEDDGFFADGLTEEILNALSQLPELQVRARTSSFFFKGQNIPVPEIADRLNVVYVVEGSVRRDGNLLRITAQLLRASDDLHLWSQTYDATLENIFTVQEDIAEKIVMALGVVLDDNARRIMRSAGIRDVDAFLAYQKGRKAFADAHESGVSLSHELVSIADAYIDQALEAAPGLTAARLMKADLRGHIVAGIASGSRVEQYEGEARDNLTALLEELDTARQLSVPGNQRDILDVERTFLSDDWSNLPNLIPRALQPAGCVQMNWAAESLQPLGWAEQLAEKFRDMLTCDPLDNDTNYNLPWALLWAGDPEAALRAVDEAENRGLHSALLRWAEFDALLAAGRVEDAKVIITPGGVMEILHEALAGDPVLARELVEDFWANSDEDWRRLQLAAVVGDREKANQLAARIDSRTGGFVLLVEVVGWCYCGAPFDLDATPNLKSRIEEVDFPWPPPTIIDYPMKTW